MNTTNSESLARLIQDNPKLEAAIQNIHDDYKRTSSMFIHELRNPLALLKGTLQYIETKHPEAKDFKYWEQLSGLILDMEHMMSNVSQFNIVLHKDQHDMVALIGTITNNHMPQANEMGIDLQMFISSDCEPLFRSYYFDPLKFKQVLNNLLKNAFEETVSGNYIHIHLSHIPMDKDGLPKLSITVSNNGNPISKDQIDHIFQPFITYKKDGTGVGLAVVKKIIEMHFGSIEVTSDQENTCFTITLPLTNSSK